METVGIILYLLVGAGYSAVMADETELPRKKWRVWIAGAMTAIVWPIRGLLDLVALIPGAKKRFSIE